MSEAFGFVRVHSDLYRKSGDILGDTFVVPVVPVVTGESGFVFHRRLIPVWLEFAIEVPNPDGPRVPD